MEAQSEQEMPPEAQDAPERLQTFRFFVLLLNLGQAAFCISLFFDPLAWHVLILLGPVGLLAIVHVPQIVTIVYLNRIRNHVPIMWRRVGIILNGVSLLVPASSFVALGFRTWRVFMANAPVSAFLWTTAWAFILTAALGFNLSIVIRVTED